MKTLRIFFNQITSYFTVYNHNSVVGSLYACNIGAGTCSRLLRQLEVSSHKKIAFWWLSSFIRTYFHLVYVSGYLKIS